MGYLSDSLRDMGFVPTGEESPVDESGLLWSKGHEVVCDETAVVIDGNHHVENEDEDDKERQNGRIIYRYDTSEKVKLPGGFSEQYEYQK